MEYTREGRSTDSTPQSGVFIVQFIEEYSERDFKNFDEVSREWGETFHVDPYRTHNCSNQARNG